MHPAGNVRPASRKNESFCHKKIVDGSEIIIDTEIGNKFQQARMYCAAFSGGSSNKPIFTFINSLGVRQ